MTLNDFEQIRHQYTHDWMADDNGLEKIDEAATIYYRCDAEGYPRLSICRMESAVEGSSV
jgi:hypothetical protein